MKYNDMEFYKKDNKVIEGFIGDDTTSLDKVKMVFILREPNSKGEIAGKFWFKEIVENNNETNIYFSKLGAIACLLLQEKDKQKALKKCAYINLHPEKGESSVSKAYTTTFNAFKNKDSQNTVAKSRWEIINSLPNGCKIVTVGDIFNAIKININPYNEKIQGLTIKNNRMNKDFDAFSFNNDKGNIEVYSIYHPQSYGRNYFKADDIKLNYIEE